MKKSIVLKQWRLDILEYKHRSLDVKLSDFAYKWGNAAFIIMQNIKPRRNGNVCTTAGLPQQGISASKTK